MKAYKITEYKPAMAVWEYTVQADNATDALALITNGEVEPYDFGFSIDEDGVGPHYEINEEYTN